MPKKMIKSLYLKALRISKRPQALWVLLAMAFVESIFLPIPAMTIFIIVALAQHRNALWIALLVTIASTLGGFFGYAIGAFFWEQLSPIILSNDKAANYFQHFKNLYNSYGAFAVMMAAITPVPFKLAAIASGIANMNFLIYAMVSFIGRFIYFFTPALFIFFMGSRAKYLLEKNFYVILIFTTIIALIILFLMRFI